MRKLEIYFIALLANADESILKLSLEHGFKFEQMTLERGTSLIASFESLPLGPSYGKIAMDFKCYNPREDKIYLITNTFQCNAMTDKDGVLIAVPREVLKFDEIMVKNYLSTTVRLMRLFKEGNVCIPQYYYCYSLNTDNLKAFMRGAISAATQYLDYHIKDDELTNLHEFIQNNKLPFQKQFLQLAFENIELSYHIHSTIDSCITNVLSKA